MRKIKIEKILAPTIAIIIVLLAWQLLCMSEVVPSFMLPTPLDVVGTLVEDAAILSQHAAVTVIEAGCGLGFGIIFGFILAVAIDRFKLLDLALSPLMTISQTVPVVAIAPLLVLWLGYDMLPKILLVALTTFFPITVALVSGFKSVDRDEIDLLKTMGASRFQIFRYVKIPASTAEFFTGLRISCTYAMVGAVVAEWLGGFSGLGVYMTRVRKSYDYEGMFAAIFVIIAVSLLLLLLIKILERVCMPWNKELKEDE